MHAIKVIYLLDVLYLAVHARLQGDAVHVQWVHFTA